MSKKKTKTITTQTLLTRELHASHPPHHRAKVIELHFAKKGAHTKGVSLGAVGGGVFWPDDPRLGSLCP